MAFNKQILLPYATPRSNFNTLSSYKSLTNLQGGSKIHCQYHSTFSHLNRKMNTRQIRVIIQQKIREEAQKNRVLTGFLQLLNETFQERIKQGGFVDYKDVLKISFKSDQLYFLVIDEDIREKCTQLIENERNMNDTNANIWGLCLILNQAKFKELKGIYDRKKIKNNDYVYHFYIKDQNLSQEVLDIVKKRVAQTAVPEKRIVRRWASTKRIRRESEKKMNFFCESILYKMLLNYKYKTKNPSINIVEFNKFEDLAVILKIAKISSIKQTIQLQKTGSYVDSFTSKISNSQHLKTTLSYFPKAQVQKNQDQQQVAQYKIQQQETTTNIIICRKYNDQIKKIRAFVNTERKNWHLWEISDSATDIFANLKSYFGQYEEESQINDYKLYENMQYKTDRPQKMREQCKQLYSQILLLDTNISKFTPIKQLKSTFSASKFQTEEETTNKNNLFSKLIPQQSILKDQSPKDMVAPQPIIINFDKKNMFLQQIKKYESKPITAFSKLKLAPNFQPKQLHKKQALLVEFQPSTIDSEIPTLMKFKHYLPDKQGCSPLGGDLLNKIKEQVLNYNYLECNLDKQNALFSKIIVKNDQFLHFFPIELPKKPRAIYKLAVLYPQSIQFNSLGEILKNNLQPEQSIVTLLPFASKQQLEDYYKSKDEKILKFDKILLFLSETQAVYQLYIKSFKQKLLNKLDYFVISDKFLPQDRQRIVFHLPYYQIKNRSLPFQTTTLSNTFYSCKQYIILVSSSKISKYNLFANDFIRVVQYKSFESYKYLKRINSFVIVVVDQQQFHQVKTINKYSKTCGIIVDSQNELKQDQFSLYKVEKFALYYGPKGTEYLTKILPAKAPENNTLSKYLFFKKVQISYAFDSKYDDYDKIEYSSWEQIYSYVVIAFRGLNNFLLKVFNQAHTIVSLQPVVYMERPLYIKQFKYFSYESHSQSLAFWDLPQIFYQNQLSLTSKLQAEQTPGIILYSKNNERWMSNLKLKHNDKFKWFCLQDQSWIDEEGNLNSGTDLIKLSTKIKLFSQMFNYRTFKGCNELIYMMVTTTNRYEDIYMKTIKTTEKDLLVKKQEQVIQSYEQVRDKVFIVFVEESQQKPLILLEKSKESNSRIKLIFVHNKFTQDAKELYLKYTEINPVIKHIQKLQKLGKRSFIIYHTIEGKLRAQSFITERGLGKIQQKSFKNIRPQLQTIAAEIKGHYKQIFLVCFQDQKRDIDRLLNSYSISNANQQHALQFVLMKRVVPPKNFKKDKKLELNFSQIKEQEYCCCCDGREQYELAIQSGPHSCIKNHDNEKKKEDEESFRGNLPIQSSQHLDGRKVKMLNIEDYSRIYIVYQQNLELQNKKQLLVACSKNQKLRPVLYNSISQLKMMKEEINSLMLFFMKEIPMELFTELVEKQKQEIVFNTTNLKAVLPKNTDINLHSITSHFSLANLPAVKRLKVEQVNQYLKAYQQQSKSITPKLSVIEHEYGLQPASDHTKSKILTVVNPIEQEYTKLKKSLNGSLLVLLVDFEMRNKYTTLAVKYKCLIQSYSGDNILQNEIKTKTKHIVLCLIGKNILPKLQTYKQKYTNIFFLLELKRQEQLQNKDRVFLAGQFDKDTQFQKIIADLSKQNEKISQSNPENAYEYNSDISGKQKKQERTNFHYQSMMSKAEQKKLKQAAACSKPINLVLSQQPIKKAALSTSRNKLKVMQKGNKIPKNNQYYQA